MDKLRVVRRIDYLIEATSESDARKYGNKLLKRGFTLYEENHDGENFILQLDKTKILFIGEVSHE